MTKNKLIKEYLVRLQSLEEKKKKIILVSAGIICGLILGFYWLSIAKKRIENIKINKAIIKGFNISSLKNETKKIKQLKQISKQIKIKEFKNFLEILERNPEKREKVEELIEKNPQLLEELIEEPTKLEELIKNL